MLPLLLAMLAKAKGKGKSASKGKRQRQKAKAKGKQLMPSFAFDCPLCFLLRTFAFDYAPLLLTTQRKGKRRKGKRRKGKRQRNLCPLRISKGGKRGALFLCTFACDYPLLLTMQPLLLAMLAKAKGKGKRQATYAFLCF
jgi:hypothetical protein